MSDACAFTADSVLFPCAVSRAGILPYMCSTRTTSQARLSWGPKSAERDGRRDGRRDGGTEKGKERPLAPDTCSLLIHHPGLEVFWQRLFKFDGGNKRALVELFCDNEEETGMPGSTSITKNSGIFRDRHQPYISSGRTRRQYQAALASTKMAFTRGSLLLLCGLAGLLTGVWSAKIVPAKGNNCPKGWTQLESFCYIYEGDGRTFADAESICNILGGNLVSIHNELENALVLELIRAGGDAGEAWIGYTDAISEGDFLWTDGSEVDFTNFIGGTDNNAGDCVEMVTNVTVGEWDDGDCTAEFPYVCIREASSH